MLITIIFLFGPIIVLFALGVVSIHLTSSGYFPGRARVGWALFGITLAVFFPMAAWRAGTGAAGVGALFHILFLSLLLMLQAPLLVELITLAVMPDSSRGLKVLKVHTEAEKKVIQDDLPGAILEYESIIAEDPGDIEARFRLAELRYQNKEYRKSASAYEALLEHKQELDIDRHCSILTRLSEIYAHQLGDVETARAFVQRIVSEYPDTRYAVYARERIDNL